MFAIETHQLRRAFDERVAVEGLTLNIPAGSVFAFLGPNGAGKTTTVRMLTGLLRPSGGTARVAGHDVVRETTSVRERVGLLTEAPGLYERLSAQENLAFFGQIAGLSVREAAARSERYLRRRRRSVCDAKHPDHSAEGVARAAWAAAARGGGFRSLRHCTSVERRRPKTTQATGSEPPTRCVLTRAPRPILHPARATVGAEGDAGEHVSNRGVGGEQRRSAGPTSRARPD